MTDYPEVLLTGPAQRGAIPKWLEPFPVTVVRFDRISSVTQLPALTVVFAHAIEAVMKERPFLKVLSQRFEASPEPSKIIFVFEQAHKAKDQASLEVLLTSFGRSWDLEFAKSGDEAESELREALAKIRARMARAADPPAGSDPLGKLRGIIASTSDLRTGEGVLSADLVARTFNLSLSELSTILGRTRQSVSKTPDAASLQGALRQYERIARLRAVLKDSDFAKWLNLPNEQLDGSSPLEIIRSGRVEVVADLAENMLIGAPT